MKVVAALMLLALFSAPALADSAVAISKSCPSAGRFYGYSFNHLSPTEAEEEALERCKQPDCKVAHVVRNKCMALAFDNANLCGAIGIGHEASANASAAAALKECASSGGRQCLVVAKWCDQVRVIIVPGGGNNLPNYHYKLNPMPTPQPQPQPCMSATCGGP